MAIGTLQYKQKLAVWLTAFKSHTNSFAHLNEAEPSQLKTQAEPSTYIVQVKSI